MSDAPAYLKLTPRTPTQVRDMVGEAISEDVDAWEPLGETAMRITVDGVEMKVEVRPWK